jgi:hypothetical protein
MLNLKEDYKDYLALLTILSFGLLAFVYLGFDRQLQMAVIAVVSVFYVLWGAYHHLSKGDFHFKVLVEYLAIAFLGVVFIFTLLSRT